MTVTYSQIFKRLGWLDIVTASEATHLHFQQHAKRLNAAMRCSDEMSSNSTRRGYGLDKQYGEHVRYGGQCHL